MFQDMFQDMFQGMFQVELDEERIRRHAAFEEGPAGFSEDGVPVKNKKYAAYKKDGQGRVEIPLAYIHNFVSSNAGSISH